MRRGRWGDIIGAGVGFALLGALVWAVNAASKPKQAQAAAPPAPAPSGGPTQHGGGPAPQNTPLEPDLTSWPTVKGRVYRIQGRVRRGTTQQGESVLLAGGFPDWTTRTALPVDWPQESLVPLSKDEIRIRGDGTWSADASLPSALPLSSDPNDTSAVIIDQVWEYSV